MTISSNIHGATAMVAEQRDQTSWLKITTPNGHAVVFMPYAAAVETADAFNAAMSAQPAIQEEAE